MWKCIPNEFLECLFSSLNLLSYLWENGCGFSSKFQGKATPPFLFQNSLFSWKGVWEEDWVAFPYVCLKKMSCVRTFGGSALFKHEIVREALVRELFVVLRLTRLVIWSGG